MTEPKAENNSPDTAIVRQDKSGYGDEVCYRMELRHPELAPEILRLTNEIQSLTKKREELIGKVIANSSKPAGWKAAFHRLSDYDGSVEMTVSRSIWREKTPAPPSPKREERTALETLLRLVDAKTLFNSGILTPDEKRKLLNVEELIKQSTPIVHGAKPQDDGMPF